MNPQPHQTRAFFGRRKGHKLRPNQARLMETLLPQLAIDLSRPAPAELSKLFSVPVGEIALEIGFGGGESMVEQAQAHPRTGMIGVEPFVNGMAKALSAIESGGLQNIRLHFDDATGLIAWLPEAALSRVDLIHPDPWPKRRHWKRRFVQDTTIAAMARVLKPNGEFRFVSDIDGYCAWTLWHFARSPDFAWTAERAPDWREPWAGYTMTRYGRKATREGRVAAYLIFRKTSER